MRHRILNKHMDAVGTIKSHHKKQKPLFDLSSRSLSRLYKRATNERCIEDDFRFDDVVLPGRTLSKLGSRRGESKASAMAV